MSETGQDAAAPAAPAPQAGQAAPDPARSRTPDTGWRPPSRPQDGRSADGSPSLPPPPADGRAESGAEGPAERASPASDFLNRLFGRKGVRSAGAAGEPEGPRGEPASRPDADGREPSPPRPDAPPAQPLSERAGAISQQLAALSGDELQELAQADGPFSRAVQSEIDRRVARANKQRDEQGRFTRQQRVEGLKQQARELRQTDVYRAAELEEQVDALQQQEGFVRGLVEHYDRVSLDPIMAALPEADRAPLLADLPEGLDGRLQLVRAALRRLEQVWRADEARKLRGGPQRKRDNAQRRAQRAEDDGEPELVAGIGRGRNGAPNINDWLRSELTRR